MKELSQRPFSQDRLHSLPKLNCIKDGNYKQPFVLEEDQFQNKNNFNI